MLKARLKALRDPKKAKALFDGKPIAGYPDGIKAPPEKS